MKNNSVINGGTFQGKPKRREIPKRKFRYPRMTVCIAMIAKNTQSGLPTIVFTADKLVSTNTVCFEGGNPKIAHLYPHTYVMTSSDDALSSDEIVIKTQQKLSKLFNSDENLTVEQIVNILSQECKSKYELEIEERRKQIFSRYDFTSEEFKFKSKDLSEKIVLDVIESLHEIEYDFKTNYFKANFLIVGIDTEPHIYVVNELGKIEIFDHIGFATIGSGQFLAFPEITRSAYLSNISDVTAVMTVYKAKKAAERISGVGEKTDLWLLRKDENNDLILAVANDILKELLDKSFGNLREKETELNKNTADGIKKFKMTELFQIVKFKQNGSVQHIKKSD